MRAISFSALVLVALGACTPSTFDGLTGSDGKRGPFFADPDPIEKDEALRGKDPRPVSPFSGSWVNTAHPRFTWKLQAGTSGAVLELAKNRDFTDAKRITATGSEATVEGEPLVPGVYFWRLQARAGENGGVSYSPTWTVLVRGPSKNATKENAAAHGGFVDPNGDGVPDLNISLTTDLIGAAPPAQIPFMATLYGVGGIDQRPTFDPFNADKLEVFEVATDAPAIAAGFDINGDGYGDTVLADVWTASMPGAAHFGVGGVISPLYGVPFDKKDDAPPPGEETEEADESSLFPELVTQPFTKTPVLAVGDFNGDGFGDFSAIFSDLAMTVQGGTAYTVLPFEAPGSAPPTTFLIGAGDFDGDGFSDLAYTPFDSLSPLRLAQGARSRYATSPNLTAGDLPVPARPTALTTGDFDGDGFDEVAFSTTVNGRAAVCVHTVGQTALNAHACWLGDEPTAGFGITLAAGDLDGDGVDEILVGSTTTGITMLTHAGIGYSDASSVFTATPITGPYTPHFSVFYPGGRFIGKAHWAAFGTDKKLYVFEGIGAPVQTHDFTKLKELEAFALDFVRFGTSIR